MVYHIYVFFVILFYISLDIYEIDLYINNTNKRILLMFIDYIIELWECGKAHILHIGSLDDLPSEVEISDEQVITIGGDRLSINDNLSDTNYGDFFEVGYNKGGGPCTIIFKRGKTKSVKVKTGFESVGKKGGYYLIKTKVIACM